MCGIAGAFAYRDSAPRVDDAELRRVSEHMARRGPDGSGLWVSPDRRVGLAHRRLAIIDLSAGGAQPMSSADGRYRITFNGEIYNYRELRSGLEAEGAILRTRSDTEVLLELYARRGETMLDALRGMYAFALWDDLERTLFLTRDPFGIKPLYYADDGGTLRFASQVKALLAGNAIECAPEPAGFVGFMLLGSVPEPYTLYRNVRSLAAGSSMRVSAAGPVAASYFDVSQRLREAQDVSTRSDPAMIEEAVRDSVRAHLVADVPVGVFLSGGIDSGTIVGLASEAGTAALNAVTLGFREFRDTPNDEAALARDIAARNGVAHRSEWIEREDFEALLPEILAAMDQPSIDGVNTFLVSRAAAQNGMKVALSGVGGDELFGGYPSFREVPRLVRALQWTRRFRGTGRAARRLTQHWIGLVTSPKYAGLLEYGSTTDGGYLLRRGLFMPWELNDLLDPALVRTGLDRLDLIARFQATTARLRTRHARIAALEMSWYMRNQLLRDADWAGMAHSLEIRVPFVDARLFGVLAQAITCPAPPTKRDLARVARRPVPDAVLMRAKSGFATPVREWIGAEQGAKGRGLRKWAIRILPTPRKSFRVLALVTDAYGVHGGIAKFNRDFLGSTASMPECAEVVCLPRNIGRSAGVGARGVRVITASAHGKASYLLAALSQATAEGSYDVVVIGHINLAAIGSRVARQLRIPCELIVHGIDAWTPHRSRGVRDSLPAIDRVLGVSRITLDRLNDWAGLDASRQSVLPNCVDFEELTPGPKPPDLLRSLGLEGKTVLMTFGRLASEERYKGFDEIIELLPAIARHVPNVAYLICGDGPDRARLAAKCADLGVADRVVFAGLIEEARKADYYRLSDAYVMPSRCEGFGIVFLEALACGIPVLGSRSDGSSEALLGGCLGELVDPERPDDILEGVLRTLRRKRGVPGEAHRFSTERFRERVAAIHRDLLGIDARGGHAPPITESWPPVAGAEHDRVLDAVGSDARGPG